MKKIFSILSAFTLLFAMVFVSACGDNGKQNNEEEKYDVAVKIRNSLGHEWIFDLDTDELSCEYEYTGEEISFYPYKYNLPAHPLWSEKWLSLHGGVNNEFYTRCYIYNIEGRLDERRCVKERGRYLYDFNVDTYGEAVMQLKYRSVILNVVIK